MSLPFFSTELIPPPGLDATTGLWPVEPSGLGSGRPIGLLGPTDITGGQSWDGASGGAQDFIDRLSALAQQLGGSDPLAEGDAVLGVGANGDDFVARLTALMHRLDPSFGGGPPPSSSVFGPPGSTPAVARLAQLFPSPAGTAPTATMPGRPLPGAGGGALGGVGAPQWGQPGWRPSPEQVQGLRDALERLWAAPGPAPQPFAAPPPPTDPATLDEDPDTPDDRRDDFSDPTTAEARSRGGWSKGERGRTAKPSGTADQYKHMKPDPNDPDKVIVPEPGTGKKIRKPKPPGFDE